MKLFLKKLLFLIPIPILIILVNYFVDPANIFNYKYESGIAQYLSQGYNVTNVVNCNDRILQKLFIQKMQNCPQEIALGGSRIMLLNTTNMKEEDFRNNGVILSTLEDLMTFYSLYEKKGCKINKVILGLEAYMLNDNHGIDRWKTLENDYKAFSERLGIKSSEMKIMSSFIPFKKYKELVSFTYFNSSLQYLFKGINKKYTPTNKLDNENFTRRYDGSISYEASMRNAPLNEVDKKAYSRIEYKKSFRMDEFTHLSDRYKFIFTNFIEYLESKNIEIEFVLFPYHPIIYDYFKKNNYYHIAFKAEDYFRDFALKHKIKISGSYDPSKYNMDNSYFFDGFHCNEKAIIKILENR